MGCGGNEYGRQVFIHQGDMAMLHVGGRITFGMDGGDLLQFQRACKGNRESVSASQKQKAMSVFVFCSDGADLLISLQGFFYFFGDTIQLMEKFLKPLAANGTDRKSVV